MGLRVNQVGVLVFVDATRVHHADEAAGHREGPHLAARHPPAHINREERHLEATEQKTLNNHRRPVQGLHPSKEVQDGAYISVSMLLL